jgi:hypothetical protein
MIFEVSDELRHGLDTRHQKVIPSTRACDIKQVSLGVVDLLQIGIITDGFDSLLEGNDLVVTRHHDHASEF